MVAANWICNVLPGSLHPGAASQIPLPCIVDGNDAQMGCSMTNAEIQRTMENNGDVFNTSLIQGILIYYKRVAVLKYIIDTIYESYNESR